MQKQLRCLYQLHCVADFLFHVLDVHRLQVRLGLLRDQRPLVMRVCELLLQNAHRQDRRPNSESVCLVVETLEHRLRHCGAEQVRELSGQAVEEALGVLQLCDCHVSCALHKVSYNPIATYCWVRRLYWFLFNFFYNKI